MGHKYHYWIEVVQPYHDHQAAEHSHIAAHDKHLGAAEHSHGEQSHDTHPAAADEHHQNYEVGSTELEKAVDKALDKKLAPLLAFAAKYEAENDRFSKVVGGIGYIVGLLGVVMYFKAKQENV